MKRSAKPSDISQMQAVGTGDLDEARRARNTIWYAAIILGLSLASILFDINLLRLYPSWQLYVLFAVTILLGVSSIAAVYLTRHGKSSPGALLLDVGVIIMILTMAALVADAGLMLALAFLVGRLISNTQTLPRQWSNWAIIVSIFIAAIAGLLEFYAASIKISLLEITRFLPIVASVGILCFIIYLLLQFRTLDLTNKFFIIFLVITLASAGAIAYITQRSTTQALTRNVGNSISSVANSQAQAIGEQLGRQADLLYSLSINKDIVDALKRANVSYTGDEAAIQDEIALLDEQWTSAVATGNKYNPLLQARLNNETARQLKEYKRTYIDQAEIFVTDRYGALFATTDVTSDYNQADEEWWQRAYNDGKGGFYFSSPVFDESANILSVQIAVPVYDYETPKVLGVLRTTYSFVALYDILDRAFLGATGEADLVFPGEDDTFQHLHHGKVGPMEPDTVLQLAQYSMDNYVEIEFDGVQSFVSQAQVFAETDSSLSYAQDITDLGWLVVVHQSSEEALQPVREQTRATYMLILVVASLVSIAAIWLAGILARPIIRLTRVAERVREGDLEVQAPVGSSDEVGQLAETFNEMTTRLRQTLAGLEQRISERTRELTLSGEVGRSLSQERDLDRLLKNAVELIQANFDLYYTQIYLVDPAGETLVLRSGTGSVGEELLRRRHRLPIGPGSINGLAAAERRPVIVADTETSAFFRPNPLLPETRSEMAMPLAVGERVVGVLDMQSQRSGALSEEVLPAFESLSGQLAVAIENASLFNQAQQARSEVENQARRLTREGWREFLDAIERSERAGFIYDQAQVKPIGGALAVQGEGALVAPIRVTGETVGSIQLERDATQGWTPDESDLVAAVADQVARQVENLRLLTQAERYRAEAENAIRQLTRQGWEEHLGELGGREIGFVYDQTRVQPSGEGQVDEQGAHFTYPLTVRDETIGELVFGGDGALGEEDIGVINQVAERLSAHLENLRLSAQTQSALATTEALYKASDTMVRASTMEAVLQAVVESTALRQFDRGNLSLYNRPWADTMPETSTMIAGWNWEALGASFPVGTQLPMEAMPFYHLLRRDEPIVIQDILTDERLDERTRAMFSGTGGSVLIYPLVVGEMAIGTIAMTADTPVKLTDNQIRQIHSLIGQAAAIVQAIYLLQQTQTRARQEQILRQVTERVRSSTDPDTVLRTAVRELGGVLGRNVLIRLGGQGESEEVPDNGDGNE